LLALLAMRAGGWGVPHQAAPRGWMALARTAFAREFGAGRDGGLGVGVGAPAAGQDGNDSAGGHCDGTGGGEAGFGEGDSSVRLSMGEQGT
jgi:hypothetical protein